MYIYSRFKTPLTPSLLHRALLILAPLRCHFRESVVRSFFFFECLARKWSPWIIYVGLIFVALKTWPCPCSIALVGANNNYLDSHLLVLQNSFSSYSASSFLINFNSMTFPFTILRCSVHLLLCIPCPEKGVCLERSLKLDPALFTRIDIRCVDDIAITLQWPL